MRKHSHSRTHKECKAKLSLSLSGHTKWRAHTHTSSHTRSGGLTLTLFHVVTLSHTDWKAHTITPSQTWKWEHSLSYPHPHSLRYFADHFLHEGKDKGVPLFTFSMKGYFLDEGVDDGGSALHILKKRNGKGSTLHFFYEGKEKATEFHSLSLLMSFLIRLA